jgi:hypothetical protein
MPVAPERTTIELVAGKKSSGDPAFEEVLVDVVGEDVYRLVASPGLVLGVAAGDEIKVTGGQFEVVSRGGTSRFRSMQSRGLRACRS